MKTEKKETEIGGERKVESKHLNEFVRQEQLEVWKEEIVDNQSQSHKKILDQS